MYETARFLRLLPVWCQVAPPVPVVVASHRTTDTLVSARGFATISTLCTKITTWSTCKWSLLGA